MELTARTILQNYCLASTLNFTCHFFKRQYNKKFVIGDHHLKITDALDLVLQGKIRKLIINIAPRYGKTELAVKSFIANGLAINPASKFIHLSYSDDLALDNSEAVKDLVSSPDYQAVFPDVVLKQGSGAKKKWYTTQGGGVYATAAGGQVTGFGAGLVDQEADEDADLDEMMPDPSIPGHKYVFGGALIIDDPIKPDDADSETVRERVNNRFDSTIVNRVNSRNTPIIIIMQRLHEKDLCGHVMENYPGEWTVLSLPCIITDRDDQPLSEGRALWEFKHTLNELLKMNNINPINFGRQYQQNPQPKEGLLYSAFKTYLIIPASKKVQRKSYTDTADEGKDFLCSISYIETELACYVTDVIYTQAPMEATEPLTAQQLCNQQIQLARVESNNGGRGFARAVEAQCRLMRNLYTKIEWFHQSDNKHVRIFTNSAKVTNLVIFPEGWEKRWPVFHKHVTAYSAIGKNAHDDAEDCLTGIVEYFGKDNIHSNTKALSAFG
ncbi:MAG: phage terminase large subunit [Legionellaceae bacterium]|nr:phage terminase large subunit [Legionellaceae bacterium]